MRKQIPLLKCSNGFSFVELAMVIAVIGLIIASVMTGQAVLNAAKLKAMVSEVQTLKNAVGQFDAIYSGLPGDIADATDYWSASGDGNKNGEIAMETSNEAFRALQQLALAGFIDGTYSGTWGSGFVVGGNVMKSKLDRGAALYMKCCGGEGESLLTFKNHVNVFTVDASDITKRAGVVTPEEAVSIDVKIDDGDPDKGFVGALGGYVTDGYKRTNCLTGSILADTSAYDLTSTDITCQMFFAYD